MLLVFLAQAMTSILHDTVERQPDGGQAGALCQLSNRSSARSHGPGVPGGLL